MKVLHTQARTRERELCCWSVTTAAKKGGKGLGGGGIETGILISSDERARKGEREKGRERGEKSKNLLFRSDPRPLQTEEEASSRLLSRNKLI